MKVKLAVNGSSEVKIISTLGQGAQGIVHEILMNGRKYAMKVYNADIPHSVAAQRRSRKIGKVLAKAETGALNRALMMDNGYDKDDNPIMVYKLFNHSPVEDYFSRYTMPKRFRQRERMAVGLTAGLVEIHRKGIIHADLAPINVLYSNLGTVAIIDFDGAGYKPTNGEKELKPIVHGHQDFPGWVTPSETVLKDVSKKTDIWWLGSLIMKVLTGYNPFFFLKVADEGSLKELFEMLGSQRIEWPPKLHRISRHSKIQPNLTEVLMTKVRKIINYTIATASLGDVFRNYYSKDKRPTAVQVWSGYRSRVFR